MSNSSNNYNEYNKLEDVFLRKLSNYNIQQKQLFDHYNKYINNVNTSSKNKNFLGQNVFVNELDSDNLPTSFYECEQVDLSNWEDSNLPSSLISFNTCKDYSIRKNKQYFGIQEIDNERKCYVKHSNVKETYTNSGGGFPVQYWKSTKGNANANVLLLGFNGIISLISYTSSSWLQASNINQTYWTEGKKYEGCDQIWGGTITGITGVYGKNCKDQGKPWDEIKGIDHVNQVFSDKLLHTPGQNVLINNDFFGGTNNDPCPGSSKDIAIQIKCGSSTQWNTINSSENSYVDINCNKFIKNCKGYYGNSKNKPPILRLTDNGDLCIFKVENDNSPTWCLSSVSSDVNNINKKKKKNGVFRSGWANDNGFNVNAAKPLIQDQSFNDVSWLYNRDYLNAGEPFQTGMLLASKSGNCAMVLQDDGYLYLYYASSGCSSKKPGYFGIIQNVLGIHKIDTKRPMTINNLGKVGYVIGEGENKGMVKPYPVNNLIYSDKFSKDDKNTIFNVDEKDVKQYSNLDLKECKNKCQSLYEKCVGITWTEPYAPDIGTNNLFEARPGRGTCYITNSSDYSSLLSQKTEAKGRYTSYKLPKVENNNSCNDKNINLIENSLWHKYDVNNFIGPQMSPNYLCGLAAITRNSKNKLDKSYKELKDAVDNIANKLKTLNREEQTLLEERDETVVKLKRYIKKFDAIQEVHKNEDENFNRYRSLEIDTRTKNLSNDNKYIYLGLLTVIIIIISLNLSK